MLLRRGRAKWKNVLPDDLGTPIAGGSSMVKKATRMSRFVVAVEDQPFVDGVDLHKRAYSVALFFNKTGR